MAEEDDAKDSADRTEAATPKRIERAREEGQVAMSREAAGWVALLLATIAAGIALQSQGTVLMRAMRVTLESAHRLDMLEVMARLSEIGFGVILPVAAATAVGAVLATLVQTRFLVSAKALTPQLSKISPLAGAKRLVGPEAMAEFLRTLFKIAVVGGALWWAIGDLGSLQAGLHQPAGMLISQAASAGLRLMMAALIAFAGVAVLDLVWVHYRHQQTLRMSRQDLKEEFKESEGDPMFRARRRQMRERLGRSRMMSAVPKAAVVITNPTHYAVALAYGDDQAAPKIVAKGVDAMAARIRATAEQAGVPLVANPPLARALHRLDMGAEIPAEHYQAVAEIIAFVWKRRGQGLPAAQGMAGQGLPAAQGIAGQGLPSRPALDEDPANAGSSRNG